MSATNMIYFKEDRDDPESVMTRVSNSFVPREGDFVLIRGKSDGLSSKYRLVRQVLVQFNLDGSVNATCILEPIVL